MKYLCYTLLLSVVLLSACKKENSSETFVINNTHPFAVNMDLYKTDDDYANNKNIFLSKRIEASAAVEIPYASLDGNSKFYTDVYSDDCLYDNWLFATSGIMIISPAIKTHSIFLKESVARNVLLAKNKTQTTWKAIHARSEFSNYPIWNELSEEERHVKMTITKSQHCFLARGQQGIPTPQYVEISTPSTSEIYMVFKDGPGGLRTGQVFYEKGSVDTLLLYEPFPKSPFNASRVRNDKRKLTDVSPVPRS